MSLSNDAQSHIGNFIPSRPIKSNKQNQIQKLKDELPVIAFKKQAFKNVNEVDNDKLECMICLVEFE